MKSFLGILISFCALLFIVGCFSDQDDYYRLNFNTEVALEEPPSSSSPDPVENSVRLCNDGIDNDFNDLADCDDPVCKEIMLPCNIPTSSSSGADPVLENTKALCTNGFDDDSNGATDCNDVKCQELIECMGSSSSEPDYEDTVDECQDGDDNDGDGDIDCEDSECQLLMICVSSSEEPNPPLVEDDYNECRDQRDNDGDNKIDCQDEDCLAWTFCEGVTTDPDPNIDWFVNTDEVHTIPGKVQAEYFIAPETAEDSVWSFFEATPDEVELTGTNGPSNCRTDVQQEFGVDITGSNADAGRSDTPVHYSGTPCTTDAEITYIRYGEELSYGLVVKKTATFRVLARVASGHNASDTYSTPPYAFGLVFYNPRDKLLIEKTLSFYILDTGNWAKYEDFYPQQWVVGTEYNEDCNQIIAGWNALQSSNCWLSALPEDYVTLAEGQWIMAFVSQEGAYNLNYFEFEEVEP